LLLTFPGENLEETQKYKQTKAHRHLKAKAGKYQTTD
jgi:hypothetical protein